MQWKLREISHFLLLQSVKFETASNFTDSSLFSRQMKNRPVHENLDTSYVNLSALVRYLRRRQFVGNIRVELSGYEADITLTAQNEMRIREHDRIAGRISEGEEALQRLLIRAREPGGIINVYQAVEAEKKFAPPIEKTAPKIEEVARFEEIAQLIEEKPVEAKPVSIVAKLPYQNGNHKNGNHKNGKAESPVGFQDLPESKLNQPEFPFELSNNFEDRARQTNLAPQDWQMLLNLTAELLSSIDKTLAGANLEFTLAFDKARMEISGDYPFLNPASGIFDYRMDKITVREQINAKLFAASINEALRRILEKLGRNPKFSNVYLITTHKILELIEKRQPLYDKYSITPQLAKTIGI